MIDKTELFNACLNIGTKLVHFLGGVVRRKMFFRLLKN